MTTQTNNPERIVNQVIAVGILDVQRRRGRDLTRVAARNELRGREDKIVLQVASPFGRDYALPIRLTEATTGQELLDTAEPGEPLAIVGQLDWEQHVEDRYAVQAGERGRRVSELTFRALTIRAPADGDEQGCDVRIEGYVQGTARIDRHPFRPSVRLAHTALLVQTERLRNGSRARMVESQRVPIVVPLDHPDAPALLRHRNRVLVEGMLERIVIELHGEDVDRAVAALDAEWQRQRDELCARPQQLREAEHHYARRRIGLLEGARSRVVAGYVELIEGQPASVRESQELRRAYVREQRRRRGEMEPAGEAP